MKLAVIGGGGVRSMFLAKSLTQSAAKMRITEITFMDNDEKKLKIYGVMAKEVASRIDDKVKFNLTADITEAVKDADYVITTIRVGGDEKRIDDERIALELGILGQETTGAAGFSFAMRSIPVLDKYCQIIRKHAKPGVKVFNFTNPAGVVSQTLRDLGYDFTFGICDAPSGLISGFAKVLGVGSERITGECFGLNHLSFFNSIKLDGREIISELIENDRIYLETEMKYFTKDFTRKMGCILNEYLYYFFYREQAVENILKAGVTRGELIKDVNMHMMEELSKMDIQKDFEKCLKVFEIWYGKRESAYMANETGIKGEKPPFKFEIHGKDEGGYAGVALSYIESQQTGKDAEMVICVPNKGSLDFLLDTDVIEISCTISNGAYKPHRVNNVGNLPKELIHRVKVYERLASEAIRNRDSDKAIECLMLHPLVNSYSLAEKLFAKYIESNKAYIEEWR